MSSELELPRIALFPVFRAKLEIRLAQNSDRPKTKVVPRARFASANSLLRTRHRGSRLPHFPTFPDFINLTNRLHSQTNSTRPRPGLVSLKHPPWGTRPPSFLALVATRRTPSASTLNFSRLLRLHELPLPGFMPVRQAHVTQPGCGGTGLSVLCASLPVSTRDFLTI